MRGQRAREPLERSSSAIPQEASSLYGLPWGPHGTSESSALGGASRTGRGLDKGGRGGSCLMPPRQRPQCHFGVGPSQSLEEIKQHPFFQDIDWAAVMDREVQPMYRGLPWKPRVAEKDKFDADAVAQGTQIEKNKDLVQDDAKHHFDGFDWTSNSILRDTSLSVAAQVEIDKGLR